MENRGTQTPQDSKSGPSTSLTNATRNLSLEIIDAQMVQTCTQSTQTLYTIFLPYSSQSTTVDKFESFQGKPCLRLFNTENGQATDFILETVEFDNSESKKDQFFEQLKNFFK